MGSPCNEFGNGPEPTLNAADPRSSNCAAAGEYWANIGSPVAPKSNGDAYQDANCGASAGGTDNCAGGVNSDYQNDGYFYSVKLSQPVSNLTIQAFDPAFVNVGDLCGTNFGSGTSAAAQAKNQYNYNAGDECGERVLHRGPVALRGGPDEQVLHRRSAVHAEQRAAGHHVHDPPAGRDVEPVGPDELPGRGELHEDVQGIQRRPVLGAQPVQAERVQRRAVQRRGAGDGSRLPGRRSRRSSGSGSRCARSRARSRPGRTSSRCRATLPTTTHRATATTGSRCVPTAQAGRATRRSRSAATRTWRSTPTCPTRTHRST